MMYRMCSLGRENARVTGWIEDRGARLGARVEIKELGGFWDVLRVDSHPLSKEEMHERENRARQSFCSLKSYRGNK